MAPHRGAVIPVFGILSWLLCPLAFGIVAWVMGTTDLREMSEGRMDPSGRGLTEAGRILGMINVLLSIGALLLYLLLAVGSVAMYSK
jgi:hypothetical protein